MDTQPPAVGTKPRSIGGHYPQHEPLCVTVGEACRLAGVGRSKMYDLMTSERVESVKVDGRRLVVFPSLKRYLLGIAA
jgi:hypothetical protein